MLMSAKSHYCRTGSTLEVLERLTVVPLARVKQTAIWKYLLRVTGYPTDQRISYM